MAAARGRTLVLVTVTALAACDDASVQLRPDAAGDAAAPVDAAGLDATPDAAPLDAQPDLGVPDSGPDAAPPPVDAAVLAEQNAWGPLGRITQLDVPDDAPAARRAGCLVHGPAAGTGLRNVLLLAGGGLGRFLRPDFQGRIALVLFVRALGWPEGARADEVEAFELQVLAGTHLGEAEFEVAPRSFVDADPAAGPRVSVPAVLDEGWIEHPPTAMFLSIPLLTGPLVDVPLEHARLTGRLVPDGPGVALHDGVLTGYLGADGVDALVGEVQTICAAEAPPAVCTLFGDQINLPRAELVTQVIGLAGGYDVALSEAGIPGPCVEPEACNALAVCLQVAAAGAAAIP